MPVESVNKPSDLNEAWPLNEDVATQGAAHLRNLKRAVKRVSLGSFSSRDAFKTWFEAELLKNWVPQQGCQFYIDGLIYALRTISSTNNFKDNSDYFPVNNTYQAYVVSRPRILGEASGRGIYAINSNEKRRPLVKYGAVAGEVFDGAAASSLFPNNNPIPNDIVMQLTTSVPSRSFIRVFNGTSWVEVDVEVFNLFAAFAAIAATNVQAESVDACRLRSCKQEVLGETRLYAVDPEGFGPDELIMWYGEKETVVNPSGEINYNALLKDNAIRWRDLNGIEGGVNASETVIDPNLVTIVAELGGIGSSYGSSTVTYGGMSALAQLFLTMNSTGQFVIGGFESLTGNPLSGNYLSQQGQSAGDLMQVKFTSTKPWMTSGTLNTWLNLTDNRTVGASISRDTPGSSTDSVDITVEVRKSPDGTPVSKTFTVSLFAESNEGMIP